MPVLVILAGSALTLTMVAAWWASRIARTRWIIVVVDGPSMAPTLVAGDRIRARRVPPATIHRGDIVVARMPGEQRHIVKRIAAVPGDAAEGAIVPPGNYLLLGDNAADSKDSRIFGYMSAANIVGVATDPRRRL